MTRTVKIATAGLLLIITASASLFAQAIEKPKGDLDLILGKWVRVSTDGVKAPAPVTMVVMKAANPAGVVVPAGAGSFVFDWKTEGDKTGSRDQVVIDPTRVIKTIDYLPSDKNAPKVCPGIYQIEGDTMTICFRPTRGERPKEFAKALGMTLDVYRREKP